jgi:NAD+ synthetase
MPAPIVKIALAQINTTVGDFDGNGALVLDAAERARARGADLLLLPELTLSGYPPRDLVEDPAFVRGNLAALERLIPRLRGIAALVGYVEPNPAREGKSLFNAAAVIRDGRVERTVRKRLLPTYDVFDEGRHFEPGGPQEPWPFGGRKLGLTICEDAWNDREFHRRPLYHEDPVVQVHAAGADLLVNVSASPFVVGKPALRRDMMAGMARRHRLPAVLVNLVGGNDELIFDGNSFALDPDGRVVAQAASFEEDLVLWDAATLQGEARPTVEEEAPAIRKALVLGLRDYFRKVGFTKAVVGLSGGIDSAVVAALAAEALGPSNVLGVSMPSRFSSAGSRDDAAALARNLGLEYLTIPIEGIFRSTLDALAPAFAGRPFDTAEENVQARIRGMLLMALSNKFGHLVLSTGNKSELAVGYCTLYGDMAGGLAVISDVPKTAVYRLAAELNREREAIPRASIDKPPSAELRADQKDSDSLPDYAVLDPILRAFVEELKSPEEIVALGYPADVVTRVVRLVERNEYKRRQAAPGLKVTSKAFGMGRRIPIARKLGR